jgi:hypothetical protein
VQEGASGKGVQEGASGKGVQEGASGKGVQERASGKGVQEGASDSGGEDAEHDDKTHQRVLQIPSILSGGLCDKHLYVTDVDDMRLTNELLAEIGRFRDSLLLYFFDIFATDCSHLNQNTIIKMNMSAVENDLRYISLGPFNSPIFADIVRVLTTPDEQDTEAILNCHIKTLYAYLVEKIADTSA